MNTKNSNSTRVEISPGYKLETVVPGSAFHTINGIAFGPDGRLYIASVAGESLFALNIHTGEAETFVGPPQGACDDLVFTENGDIIWTANLLGAVRMRRADGSIHDLATGIPGINSIALTRDGKRLFAGQVFLGEGLWEIDIEKRFPPRLVLGKTGGLNAFQFGPDGLIYGPSWFNGEVLRIHPDSGECTVVANGLKHPGSVKFDLLDRLYALDDATGELFHINPETSDKHLVVKLATATDNMIIGSDGAMYVSNMVDNSIDRVDLETGAVRNIIKGNLGFPRAIGVSTNEKITQIHVADCCSYRVVDATSGAILDRARVVETGLGFPTSGVSVTDGDVLLTCDFFGTVQIMRPDSESIEMVVTGLDSPGAAIRLNDGRLVVTEPERGRVLLIDGGSKAVLLENLNVPVGLADAGEGAVYVTECGAGRLLRVSITDKTTKSMTADYLGDIRAVCTMPDGRVVVLDATSGTLFYIDAESGDVQVIARNLPVGYLPHPYVRSGGIAAAPDGTLFVAADRENAIYALRPSS